MTKFIQNSVTVRFLEIYDLITDKYDIKSASQLAKTLNIARQALNDIKKGNRNITIEFVKTLVNEFNVNPLWLFTGNEDIFLDKIDPKSKIELNQVLEENEMLKAENISLKTKIETLKEVIETFKK